MTLQHKLLSQLCLITLFTKIKNLFNQTIIEINTREID